MYLPVQQKCTIPEQTQGKITGNQSYSFQVEGAPARGVGAIPGRPGNQESETLAVGESIIVIREPSRCTFIIYPFAMCYARVTPKMTI
jgi:hypothetical protein